MPFSPLFYHKTSIFFLYKSSLNSPREKATVRSPWFHDLSFIFGVCRRVGKTSTTSVFPSILQSKRDSLLPESLLIYGILRLSTSFRFVSSRLRLWLRLLASAPLVLFGQVGKSATFEISSRWKFEHNGCLRASRFRFTIRRSRRFRGLFIALNKFKQLAISVWPQHPTLYNNCASQNQTKQKINTYKTKKKTPKVSEKYYPKIQKKKNCWMDCACRLIDFKDCQMAKVNWNCRRCRRGPGIKSADYNTQKEKSSHPVSSHRYCGRSVTSGKEIRLKFNWNPKGKLKIKIQKKKNITISWAV